MKARRLPARSALEQLLHQVPQRRPRLLLLPPALLNRLRLLHQLLLQQRKQILLLLLPLKQRRLLLLLLLLQPTKPATSEAPKATAKPSAEAPKPTQPASKAEAPSTQKSTTESAPVAAPASTKPVEPAKSTEPQKAKPTKPTKQAAKPASHEAASKPFANKEHVAESAIEEATKKTSEPPVKAAPATTSPSEDQLREAAEIEILVDRAAEERSCQDRRARSSFCFASNPYYERREGARAECWRTGQLIERKNTHKQGSYTR